MALFVSIKLQLFISLIFFAVLNSPHTVNGVPLSDFYAFGDAISETDMKLPANDDGSSSPISLSRVFPFFGTDHFTVYVSHQFNEVHSLLVSCLVKLCLMS